MPMRFNFFHSVSITLLFLLLIPFVPDAQVISVDHRTFKVKDKLIPYRVKDKWGFADASRRLIIPLQWDAAEPFSNSYARVVMNGKVGVIDTTGAYFIQPEFRYVEFDYERDVFKVKKDSLDPWLYRSTEGTFTSELVTIDTFGFGWSEEPGLDEGGTGTEVFYRNGKAGYFSRQYVGDKIETVDSIPPITYDSLRSDFNATILIASQNGKWGLISNKEKVLIPFQYEGTAAPNFYGVVMAKKKGKWGLVDFKNKVVLPFAYDKLHVDTHVRGYIVYKKGLCGHFNPDTKKLIPPRYLYVDGFAFHSYSMVVTKNKKRGYIDEAGNEFFVD